MGCVKSKLLPAKRNKPLSSHSFRFLSSLHTEDPPNPHRQSRETQHFPGTRLSEWSCGANAGDGAGFASEQLQIPICELCGTPRFNIRVILRKSQLVYSVLVTFISSARGDARASGSTRAWMGSVSTLGLLCCSWGKGEVWETHGVPTPGVLGHAGSLEKEFLAHPGPAGTIHETSQNSAPSWCQGVEAAEGWSVLKLPELLQSSQSSFQPGSLGLAGRAGRGGPWNRLGRLLNIHRVG